MVKTMGHMQEQQNCFHCTWHIAVETVSNGSSKITLFLQKMVVLPESGYVYSNPDIQTFLKLYA